MQRCRFSHWSEKILWKRIAAAAACISLKAEKACPPWGITSGALGPRGEQERENTTRAVSRRLGSESLGTSVGFILRVVGSQ